MKIEELFGLLIAADSFEEFRSSVEKELEREEFAAMEAAHVEKTEAENRDARFSDIDLNNLSPQMVVALGVTNGMPEWLVSQRFEAWKNAQSIE